MPCTPPPGGVADEHRYTLAIGVLHGLSRGVGSANPLNKVLPPTAMSPPTRLALCSTNRAAGIDRTAATTSRKPGAKRSKIFMTASAWSTGEPDGTCAYVHNGRRACSSVRVRGGPGRGDLPLGVCHLLARAAHVQGRRIGQPRVTPRNLTRQHEVDFRDTRT